jgi:hypothetical protein
VFANAKMKLALDKLEAELMAEFEDSMSPR